MSSEFKFEPCWKYAALVSYAGTQYCGWQRQSGSASDGGPSVQGTIEAALSRMTGEKPSVVGSGRTDSGVHAVGQVVHFVLKKREWPSEILLRGLNGLLSRDIRVLAVKPVALDFHAQRSASKKQYSYYFQQGPSELPHLDPYSWWIRKALDREAIQKALNVLIGEHDFKPFQASGAKPGPTVRRILEAEALVEPVRIPGGWDAGGESFSYLRIRLIGSGFLKQMVRGIAGTLLQIGEGRRPWQDMEKILETRDRTLVGPTAPARALWLERVWYDTLSW